MATTIDKQRDAARSREAILDAAEELFAEKGFAGTSLIEIATAAGLSRGAPNYFFGSKSQLYGIVLERVFQDRELATAAAFSSLQDWTGDGTSESLAEALEQAVIGYMDFLSGRPSFIRLIQREELSGANGLTAPRDSFAIEDAFSSLRDSADLRFDVTEAVLLFVSLTFSPLAQRNTFMASLGRDLDDPGTRRSHAKFVAAQLQSLVRAN